MPTKSSGILLYRFRNKQPEFLLVHPGGPFWAKKDLGAWSLPKGEYDNEEPLTAAIREFKEETGVHISGNFIPLSPVKSKSGKILYPFGLESDFDVAMLRSNTFTMEWPPRSGEKKTFPEVDRAAWFDLMTCRAKISSYQVNIVDELVRRVRQKVTQM